MALPLACWREIHYVTATHVEPLIELKSAISTLSYIQRWVTQNGTLIKFKARKLIT